MQLWWILLTEEKSVPIARHNSLIGWYFSVMWRWIKIVEWGFVYGATAAAFFCMSEASKQNSRRESTDWEASGTGKQTLHEWRWCVSVLSLRAVVSTSLIKKLQRSMFSVLIFYMFNNFILHYRKKISHGADHCSLQTLGSFTVRMKW
jgi:hypothetical protein